MSLASSGAHAPYKVLMNQIENLGLFRDDTALVNINAVCDTCSYLILLLHQAGCRTSIAAQGTTWKTSLHRGPTVRRMHSIKVPAQACTTMIEGTSAHTELGRHTKYTCRTASSLPAASAGPPSSNLLPRSNIDCILPTRSHLHVNTNRREHTPDVSIKAHFLSSYILQLQCPLATSTRVPCDPDTFCHHHCP
jgi:hypothetical protein